MVSKQEYAVLSAAVYNDARGLGNQLNVAATGWSLIKSKSDIDANVLKSGFSVNAYKKGNEIVIALKGTDFLLGSNLGQTAKDMLADAGLGLGLPTTQLFAAALFYEQVKQANPGATITFTGHSLGAGLASIMSVWFDRPATIFADAPFELAARNMLLVTGVVAFLANSGYVDSSLVSYASSLATLFQSREAQVTSYYVKGEVLNEWLGALPFVVGANKQIAITDSEHVSPLTLHSIVLHASLTISETLRTDTSALPTLIARIFDTRLYAAPLEGTTRDFLTSLLNFQISQANGLTSGGLLNSFANDMAKLGTGAAGLTKAAQNAIIAQGIEWYYWQTTNYPSQQFFTASGDVLQYTSALGAGLADAKNKASGYVRDWLTSYFSADYPLPGTEYGQWNVVTSTSGGSAIAIDRTKSQIFVGAGGADYFSGGSADDLLLGGGGNDYLDGGAGSDDMVGGAGDDTYNFVGYWGADNIIDDVSGAGRIVINDITLSGGHKLSQGVWRNEEQKVTFSLAGTGANQVLLITTDTGDSSIRVVGWQNGQLGLTMDDVPAAPGGRNIFKGDQRPGLLGIDIALDTPPTSPTYNTYASGTYSWTPEGDLVGGIAAPGFADVINGTSQKDLIYGYGGNDALSGNGGDDEIYGGDGDDLIGGGTGRDRIFGGAGNDYINSSAQLSVRKRIGPNETYSAPTGSVIQAQGPGWAVYTDGSTDAPVIWGGSDNPFGTDSDYVDAGDGNDRVLGGGGNDIVFGGAGNDNLQGLGGNDTIDGGDGDDVVNGDGLPLEGYMNSVSGEKSGTDLLAGGAGNDSLYGGGGDDLLDGGTGDDKMWGDDAGTTAANDYVKLEFHGNDYMDGKEGNDYMEGGGGSDTLFGGAGNDVLWGDTFATNLAQASDNALAWGNDYLDGEDGNDQLAGGGGDDSLTGGAGDDLLWGDESNSALGAAFNGNDYLDGGDGADTLVGGGGNDLLFGGKGDDVLYGDDALAIVGAAWQGADYLEGGDGNDFLIGGGGDDVLLGGAGNDTLVGGTGADYMAGGAGDDTYEVDDEHDVVFEEDAVTATAARAAAAPVSVDTVVSSASFALGDNLENLNLTGTDNIDGRGNSLNNVIYGNSGANVLVGGAGNDSLIGRLGADTLLGGTGDDAYFVDDTAARVVEATGEGDDIVVASVTYALTDNVETLQAGGDAAIDLTGNALDNTIYGNAATNVIRGGIGNDYLVGNGGDDIYLYGLGDGADAIYNVATDNATAIDRIVLGTGIGVADVTISRKGIDLMITLAGGGSLRVLEYFASGDRKIDQLVFADGTVWDQVALAQRLVMVGASEANNVLEGFESDDVIHGLGGDDTVYGYEGADQLFGDAGADRLDGGGGNDTLDGGAGNDTLYGGAGNDTYVFGRGAGNDHVIEAGTPAGGTDTVVLGAGIVEADVALYQQNDHLVLILNGGSDRIMIEGWFDPTSDNQVEQIAFADGTLWLAADMLARVIRPAEQKQMNGTAGNDTFIVENSADVVTEALNGGSDTERSSVSRALSANVENLVLTGILDINGLGNNLDNVITGNAARNILNGGGGHDTLIGGDGDDTYVSDDWIGTIVEAANGGVDKVTTYYYSYQDLTMPDNVEVLDFGGSYNYHYSIRVHGNSGDNIIYTDADRSYDSFDGGAGADTYINRGYYSEFYIDNVGDTIVSVMGAAGAKVYSSLVSYTLGQYVNWLQLLSDTAALNGTGNAAANTLIGNRGDNVLSGLDGNDSLYGYGGHDTLVGGAGNDSYYLAGDIGTRGAVSLDATIVEEAGGGIDTVNADTDYTLGANVEQLVLGSARVYDPGSGRDYTLYAVHGTGNALDNRITGNIGNNVLDGGSGIDTLVGGAGNDEYIVDDSGDRVVETAGNGIDTVRASIAYALDENVENLILTGDQAISGIGNDGENTLDGSQNSAANQLFGGAGDDTYILGAGDTIVEFADGGIDSVFSELSVSTATLGAWIEGVVLLGSEAISATGDDRANSLDGSLNVAANRLEGGLGDDRYIVGASDIVIELAGGGNDTVMATSNYVLPDNVETIVLVGIGYTATGNDLDNLLVANVQGTLDGGKGADHMIGSTAATNFYVDNVGDVVESRNLNMTDSVYSTISYALSANVGNLSLIEGAAIDGAGNDRNNGVVGNDQDNLLLGLGGRDSLFGRAGDDVLVGGTGDDSLNGGAGSDTYVVGLGDGYDEISNSADDNSTAIDTLRLGVGIAVGQVVLRRDDEGGHLLVTLEDGTSVKVWDCFNTSVDIGIDRIVFEDGTIWDQAEIWRRVGGTPAGTADADELSGWLSNEVMHGLGGNDTLYGGAGDDQLFGDDGADKLYGQDGNDLLDGGAGNDKLYGGVGNDTYVVDISTDVISELVDEGIDTVNAAITWTLGANLENLILTGTAAVNGSGNALNNSLIGNAAANTLSGGTGADTMAGGLGDDVYVVDNVNDQVLENANAGRDTVQASVSTVLGANVEVLTLTGSGAINGTGNGLDNSINGNAGANVLDGGTGADTLAGGAGNDTYVIDSSADVVVENATAGTDTVRSSISYTLGANLENLVLTGTAALSGTGNAANNAITGNDGDNLLDGAGGVDTFAGGLGSDTYIVDSTTDVITEAAGAGRDVVLSSVTLTLAANVEDLTLTGTVAINGTGNGLDNTLVGNSAVNTLTGGAGNDRLDGGAGADKLLGGAGDDVYVVESTVDVVTENAGEGTDTVESSVTLTLAANVENLSLMGAAALSGTGNALNNVLLGNSASNTLSGAAGNDTLVGGAGADTLIGGAGNDNYLFGRGDGADTVQENDTTSGNADVLQFLSGIATDQIWLRQVSNNLEVSIIGSADKLTLTNWYMGSQYHVEQFKTSDGKTLLDSQVQSLVSVMAAFSPPAAGQTTLPASYAALEASIAANWH